MADESRAGPVEPSGGRNPLTARGPKRLLKRTWLALAAAVPVVGGITGIATGWWGIIGPAVVPSPTPSHSATPTPNLGVVRDNPAGPSTSLSSTGKALSASSRPDPGTGWSVDTADTHNDALAIHAKMDPGALCAGATGWVFPEPPEQLPPLPYIASAQTGAIDAWARQGGGVPRSGNYLTLTLQEQGGLTVIIDSISAHVVRRSPPRAASNPILSGGCGGATQAYFNLDLDKGDSPEAQPAPGSPAAGVTAAPIPLPHTLGPTDQVEAWNIKLITDSCDCEFTLTFEYTVGPQKSSYEVKLPDGSPWRVSADGSSTRVERKDAGGVWQVVPSPAVPSGG